MPSPGDRPLFLTEATRPLFGQLSDTSRALLKVTGAIATQRAFLAAYRRVRYCFHQICSAADPSALPKNRRLTADELKTRTKPVTPGQAEAATLGEWRRSAPPGTDASRGRAGGSRRVAIRCVRVQLIRVFWLRHRSALCQCLVTWSRKTLTALALPGTA